MFVSRVLSIIGGVDSLDTLVGWFSESERRHIGKLNNGVELGPQCINKPASNEQCYMYWELVYLISTQPASRFFFILAQLRLCQKRLTSYMAAPNVTYDHMARTMSLPNLAIGEPVQPDLTGFF